MRYLLDTNTCIHALRGVESVVDAMAARRPSDLAVSTVTSYELHTGVQKLVTDNTGEFARVEGLAIEDWKSAST